jgi:hypothetical protein
MRRGLGARRIRRARRFGSRSLRRGLQPRAGIDQLDRGRRAERQQQDQRCAYRKLDERLAARHLAKDSF